MSASSAQTDSESDGILPNLPGSLEEGQHPHINHDGQEDGVKEGSLVSSDGAWVTSHDEQTSSPSAKDEENQDLNDA